MTTIELEIAKVRNMVENLRLKYEEGKQILADLEKHAATPSE